MSYNPFSLLYNWWYATTPVSVVPSLQASEGVSKKDEGTNTTETSDKIVEAISLPPEPKPLGETPTFLPGTYLVKGLELPSSYKRDDLTNPVALNKEQRNHIDNISFALNNICSSLNEIIMSSFQHKKLYLSATERRNSPSTMSITVEPITKKAEKYFKDVLPSNVLFRYQVNMEQHAYIIPFESFVQGDFSIYTIKPYIRRTIPR